MRVLHVIESMGRGGAERNFATILPSLHALGVENVVATLWSASAYDEQLARYSVRHDFGLKPGPAFAALPGLLRLARTVDVVHTQLAWADIVGRLAALAARKPSITTLHTTQYDRDNLAQLTPSVRMKIRAIQWLDAALARTTRRFLAVSPAVRDSYIRALGLPEGRVEVAPCMLDPDTFSPERQPPRAGLRERYGMAADELAVVAVGRLTASKRQEDAIAAVAQVSRGNRVRLYLAGTGADEARLRSLAAQLAAPVVFLGDRDDVPALLHASDVFLFPTLFEGMPMALLEAMAMGKACACSDLVEIRQLGGPALLYFQPRDVAGMVLALSRLIEDGPLRARLGTEARAAALKFADPRSAALQFVRSVRCLLDGETPPG